MPVLQRDVSAIVISVAADHPRIRFGPRLRSSEIAEGNYHGPDSRRADRCGIASSSLGYLAVAGLTSLKARW